MSAVEQNRAQRHKLENGATLLILQVPGTEQIAVEAFYWVGLVHEPAGMPQAAHLLEHLVCNAATRSYKAGESLALLNQLGLANAETMGDWTHYDYMAAAGELERVLRIEADRLSSLSIDESIIRQEGPRAAQEVDFVERNPQAGMGKFAFCALNQAWRHGSDVAQIRTGLDGYFAEELERFRSQTYRPDNLTLVLVGDFDPEAALELARKHIGSIKNPDAARLAPIDWTKAPKRATVKWDSSVQAVCIAFPPPEDATERVVLSLWGAMLQQQLAADPQLQPLADAVLVPNHMWSVGELPFFVYVAVKPGAELEKVQALLTERISKLAESGGAVPPANLVMYARQLSATTNTLNEPAARQAARAVAQQTGRDEKQALAMVLGQGAINWGIADRFLGPDPAAIVTELQALTAERLAEILRESLSEERMIVSFLMAEQDGE